MPSERQLRANRNNARHSTGPRTAAGKASAARNSFRHGLAVDFRSDSALCRQIESLAQLYCEEELEPLRIECARRAAEAQFAINRVRGVRLALFEHAAVDHETCERGCDDDRSIGPCAARRTCCCSLTATNGALYPGVSMRYGLSFACNDRAHRAGTAL